VELTWIDPANLDEQDVAGAVALLVAAQAVDAPSAAPLTRTGFIADVLHGWDGDPTIVGLWRDKRGRVVGVLQVGFSSWDNDHLGFLEVTIDPEARRQGLGRQLIEVGIDRVRTEGKSLVLTESNNSPAALAFGAALGFERAQAALKRRQDLIALDWGALDHDYALASASAPDYELLRLQGPTPDDMLDDIVTMTAAINDAPLDALDVEDEVFSPERIRAFERGQQERGRRTYRVVARHRTTGELAGHTMAAVEQEHPGFGSQYSDQDLWSLVSYVRALQNGQTQAVEIPKTTMAQLQQADPNGNAVQRGAAVYFAQGCADCHGAVGNAPANLALAGSGDTGAIRRGRPGMPAYGQEQLGNSQLADLETYMATFAGQQQGLAPGQFRPAPANSNIGG
jgi:mono/diheme cytochrome c family protein/GNAT superfamily N-acetyltransferase